MKNLIYLSIALTALVSCSIFKKQVSKEVCKETGASALDLSKTGFVPVSLQNPKFCEDESYQIQLTDTVGTSAKYELQNHLVICFSKEKPTIESMEKVLPAASLCCRWDPKMGYFSTNGQTQSVLWAYGKLSPYPAKYQKYLKDKKEKKDSRNLVYASYQHHITWPVIIVTNKKKQKFLGAFQVLVQYKDETGKVASKLVFVVGMQQDAISNLLSDNTNGVVFETSDVCYDKISGKWKKPEEVKDKNKIVYTFAWNAETGDGKSLEQPNQNPVNPVNPVDPDAPVFD